MFKKVKMFVVGLWRLAMEGLAWVGCKIVDGLRSAWHGIGVACRWLVDLPYRAMGMNVVSRVGEEIHKMLFNFLLPKRYRNATKQQLFDVIFRSDTKSGRKFDILLMVAITLSIVVLIVESLPGVQEVSWLWWTFVGLEWVFTIMFTFEYYLRIYCLKQPMKYVTSFYGIIDLLSIFPAYLALFVPAARTFMVLRLLRLLRIFVVLDMKNFVKESRLLLSALGRSSTKILIFMLFMYVMAVILGSIMYMVEAKANSEVFHSIPSGIYWAVVTLTTVGYGDVTPVTPAGRFIAMVVMILGYSIIAVPTGIVAGETIEEHRRAREDGKRNIRREDKWENSRINPRLQAGDEPEMDAEGHKVVKRKRKKWFGKKKARKAAEAARVEALMQPEVEVVYPTVEEEEIEAEVEAKVEVEPVVVKKREIEVVETQEPEHKPIEVSEDDGLEMMHVMHGSGYGEEVKQQAKGDDNDGKLDKLVNLLNHEEGENEEK